MCRSPRNEHVARLTLVHSLIRAHPQNHALKKTRVYNPVNTFANDDERRTYFLEKLREKLQDSEFRKIEGFPIGSDEHILALSDPPYYTACPNPFIEDFIKHYGKPYDPTIPYSREPFAADVSEGKNDPIYNAHSYHTKVPHKAIMRYILHYTEPGDVVFDGFCGTGMTGIAALLCGNRSTIESLGYKVAQSGLIKDSNNDIVGKTGARRSILSDLAPAATFIASNYCFVGDTSSVDHALKKTIKRAKDEIGWMYISESASSTQSEINFTIWSDVFFCPQCQGDIIFWETALDEDSGSVLETFSCPHCNATLKKSSLDRKMETAFTHHGVKVRDGDTNGFMDHAGQMVVRMKFEVSWGFHEGLALVRAKGRMSYVDKTGKTIWEPSK